MLVAAICLGGASVGVLSALRFANDRDAVAKYRTIALQLVRSNIEAAVGQAQMGSLSAGTTTQTTSTSGIPYSVTITTTTTAVAGTDRLTVLAKAQWTQNATGGTSTQTVQLNTIVRQLNAN